MTDQFDTGNNEHGKFCKPDGSVSAFDTDSYSRAVKRRIKEVRKEKKVSQEEMACFLNISLRTYQEKENPRYPEKCFDIRQMGQIADAMDIHIGILAISEASKQALIETEALATLIETVIPQFADELKILRSRLATYGWVKR